MADNDFAYRQEDAEKRRRRREAERQRRLRHARQEYIKKKNQSQEWQLSRLFIRCLGCLKTAWTHLLSNL